MSNRPFLLYLKDIIYAIKKMTKIEYINGAEFGRRLGVHRSAISAAVIKGTILKGEKSVDFPGKRINEKKGINPLDPINIKYAEALKTRREKDQAISLSKAVEKEQKNPQILKQILEAINGKDQNPTNIQENGEIRIAGSPNKLENYAPDAVKTYSESKSQQNDLIKVKTTKAQIELAQLMGILILRKDVEQFWGRVIGSLHTYIMPLDERLSEDVAAICEVTAPEIKLKVRELIKKEIVVAMAQVQNTGAEFSAILTSSS